MTNYNQDAYSQLKGLRPEHVRTDLWPGQDAIRVSDEESSQIADLMASGLTHRITTTREMERIAKL